MVTLVPVHFHPRAVRSISKRCRDGSVGGGAAAVTRATSVSVRPARDLAARAAPVPPRSRSRAFGYWVLPFPHVVPKCECRPLYPQAGLNRQELVSMDDDGLTMSHRRLSNLIQCTPNVACMQQLQPCVCLKLPAGLFFSSVCTVGRAHTRLNVYSSAT